jgi:ribonuclease Z
MKLFRAAALGLFAILAPLGASAQDFRVTLLGTGSPNPLPDRFGPSTLVEAGKEKLLFDVGRGAPIRLAQIGVPMGALTAHFLTHFHSDHVNGLPDLWLTGWIDRPYSARRGPFRIIGPTGTRAMMANLEKAYADDIRIRWNDEHFAMEAIAIAASDFNEDGIVYEKNGVKVTAFAVDHGKYITPAYGYRVDYDGRSVVISGDTRYSENLIAHAQGATLVVHEVCASNPELLKKNIVVQTIFAHHTSPQEAGTVFTKIAPKLAAYTHLVLIGGKDTAPPTPDEVATQTRETYKGPLAVGTDLMAFDVFADKVDVITVRGK